MVVDFIAFVFVIFLSRMEEIVVAVMLLKRAALLRVFVFFFSSRRRHTISLCDWSSDVCSSDLVIVLVFVFILIFVLVGFTTSGLDDQRIELIRECVPVVRFPAEQGWHQQVLTEHQCVLCNG